MSAPRPLETDYLRPAEALLTSAVGGQHGPTSFELRLQILEAASALFGGFDLIAFHAAFDLVSIKPAAELLALAGPVASAIRQSPIHHALALSTLARETLGELERRSTGAYHSDFRLATRLAELAAPGLTPTSRVIDPACGAGILLAALTQAVCGDDPAKTAHWLAHGVCAADLSPNALRAAVLSLASFTDDVSALESMRSRWYCGDSLLAEPAVWTTMAVSGFDAVIGNPPWEKVKLSRHEFLRESGAQRHYGALTPGLDEHRFAAQRAGIASYAQQLLARYPDLGNGEPDLYIAFSALFLDLCNDGGIVAALVPGGLIRSQGTRAMRHKMLEASHSISFSIIDNRGKFFAIDTRFKFLAVAMRKAGPGDHQRQPIGLHHERGTRTGMETTGSTAIDRATLAAVRADSSIPEVRSSAEWTLFSNMVAAGVAWTQPGTGWLPQFCREADMTEDRSKFLAQPVPGALPVIEGRMVQAFRFGAKAYISGAGRSAVWRACPIGGSRLAAQFWMPRSHIARGSVPRVDVWRAGFCDIAGQTNERSLMAAMIPPGVICGNKVPTVLFPEDPSEDRLLVWLAVINSIAFDWMARRVLTTTVNYFVLQSLPLPRLDKHGAAWNRLVGAARELHALDSAGSTLAAIKRMATLRCEIDAQVALAFGLGVDDVALIFEDFPILDRGQPSLPEEATSTITRDSVLAAMAEQTGHDATRWAMRAAAGRALGAMAYIPSELALNAAQNEANSAWRAELTAPPQAG